MGSTLRGGSDALLPALLHALSPDDRAQMASQTGHTGAIRGGLYRDSAAFFFPPPSRVLPVCVPCGPCVVRVWPVCGPCVVDVWVRVSIMSMYWQVRT